MKYRLFCVLVFNACTSAVSPAPVATPTPASTATPPVPASAATSPACQTAVNQIAHALKLESNGGTVDLSWDEIYTEIVATYGPVTP
jgi:hypothetical protein